MPIAHTARLDWIRIPDGSLRTGGVAPRVREACGSGARLVVIDARESSGGGSAAVAELCRAKREAVALGTPIRFLLSEPLRVWVDALRVPLLP